LAGFDYTSAAEVWDEFRQLTAGQPCDMTGITAQRLRAERHVYWPCPAGENGSAQIPGSPRRYLDQVFPTPDGRARFLPRPHQPPREATDHEFPFVLTTGRVYAHWHTLTRTAKCDKLVRRDPGAFLEIHPDDAARLGVAEGDIVQVSSRRGTIRVPARLSDTAAPGTVFLPMHWGDLFGSGNAINYLTISATDTLSKQPELKFCAVAVEKVPAERDDCADESLPAANRLLAFPSFTPASHEASRLP
jgi:ferredoxin-nitrate reductase